MSSCGARIVRDLTPGPRRFKDLFDGQVMKMYEVPAIYLPVYLAVKLPLSVLGGFAVAAFYAGLWLLRRPSVFEWWNRSPFVVVALAALLPVIYFVITVPPGLFDVEKKATPPTSIPPDKTPGPARPLS